MRPINPNRVGDWCKGFKAALAIRGIPWPNSAHFDADDDDDCRVRAVLFCWDLPWWTVWAGRTVDGKLRLEWIELGPGEPWSWWTETLPYSPETLRALLVEASRATEDDHRREALAQMVERFRHG